MDAPKLLTGRCTCGNVQYQLLDKPMFVHCCHCSWCRRESGSAFALNALIETERLKIKGGEIETTQIPSNSGLGQTLHRCANCQVVLWSHYGGAREAVAFVRVGTLNQPEQCPPDIHIYVGSKLPWVILDGKVPQMEEFYRRSEHWPEDSIARYKAVVKK